MIVSGCFITRCIISSSFYIVVCVFFFLMIRRPPRSTQSRSSAASDVYKRQGDGCANSAGPGGERAGPPGQKHEAAANACHRSLCCLLYTSPSPRDRTRSRMPSSA